MSTKFDENVIKIAFISIRYTDTYYGFIEDEHYFWSRKLMENWKLACKTRRCQCAIKQEVKNTLINRLNTNKLRKFLRLLNYLHNKSYLHSVRRLFRVFNPVI